MERTELFDKIRKYVIGHISDFHEARLASLGNLKLKKVLERKNLYLFRAKNQILANDIVKGILDSYLSSSEETVFGDWLEGLAIFVAGEVFGGKKSSALGVDLEFDRDGIHYLVSIKSGPNWGNSSQFRKMENDFRTAIRILHTSKSKLHVEAVNGCCYGRDSHPDKGTYQKLCGQEFWEFISGDPDLYLKIIEPLSNKAKEKNEEFTKQYNCKLNLFVKEFLNEYSMDGGNVNWEKLLKMNSGKKS
ncbi:MAG: PmeII family type II restriction endonuclease [Kiritimatiellia bacterium]